MSAEVIRASGLCKGNNGTSFLILFSEDGASSAAVPPRHGGAALSGLSHNNIINPLRFSLSPLARSGARRRKVGCSEAVGRTLHNLFSFLSLGTLDSLSFLLLHRSLICCRNASPSRQSTHQTPSTPRSFSTSTRRLPPLRSTSVLTSLVISFLSHLPSLVKFLCGFARAASSMDGWMDGCMDVLD